MVDRFELALHTGTDGDPSSFFWNARGHDFEHNRKPSGKRPDEIIYAFTLDLDQFPYRVLHDANIEDVTDALDEHHAVLIYRTSALERVAANEYCFTGNPKDATLLIFTVEVSELNGAADAMP